MLCIVLIQALLWDQPYVYLSIDPLLNWSQTAPWAVLVGPSCDIHLCAGGHSQHLSTLTTLEPHVMRPDEREERSSAGFCSDHTSCWRFSHYTHLLYPLGSLSRWDVFHVMNLECKVTAATCLPASASAASSLFVRVSSSRSWIFHIWSFCCDYLEFLKSLSYDQLVLIQRLLSVDQNSEVFL